jgi:hypothetical protein
MTKQEQILLLGAAGVAVTKFYFGKSWMFAAIIGLSTIAAYSIVTAQNNQS